MGNINYPKGSEWKKWDLQVQPIKSNFIPDFESNMDSIKNSVVEYIDKAKEKQINLIALTDHNTGYAIDLALNYVKRYSLDINILPGVELDSNSGEHIIVIFNDEYRKRLNFSTWKETVDSFLQTICKIQPPFFDNNNVAKKVNETTENLIEGINKDDIGIVIFAHCLSNDGFFQRCGDANRRKKLCEDFLNGKLKFIFEIKDSKQKGEVIEKLKGWFDEGKANLFPIISSSDAHEANKVGKFFTWIKADPTFEGLKQIIYEPEERVYIGEEPPRKIERNKIIKSITISNSNKWFDDKPIFLNEGLVCIIGGKGTGKTAILDLIAYATESYKCYEKDVNKSKSFLKKAFEELRGTKVKVEWKDDSSNEIGLNSKLEEFIKEGKVRYLPQDYVEQLCSEIGKNELEKQIENVIFQKIPPERKATYTDFNTYKDDKLKVINTKKKRIEEKIREINSQIYEHNLSINSQPVKEKESKKIEEEIKNYENEIKKISDAVKDSEEQKEILTRLQKLVGERSDLEKIISQLNTKLLKIDEIKNEIDTFFENSSSFLDTLKEDLKTVEIGNEVIDKVRIVLYPEDIKQILDKKIEEIKKEIVDKTEKLNVVMQNIEDENKKITLEQTKKDKIEDINKSLSELRKKKEALDVEIYEINIAKKQLPQLLKKRESLFINYFELILEEKEKLKEIYSPLENILKSSGEENEKLFDFTVKFNFDVNSMADEGHELIDLRAEGVFRQSRSEMLKETLEKFKFALNLNNKEISESDKESILKFLNEIEGLFTKDGKTIVSQLKERYTEQNFNNWLYFTKYYNLGYSINFNGIELNNLSPGLKGVALLILFLELDKEDKRPILIDQPEENLDNRSVYQTLVRYFREAKKRRQVIIVTHNPNLVVNTDAEQVIVADFDRSLEKQPSRIFYVSGSLENTFKDDSAKNVLEKQGIREHVCLILEGGKDAFEKREKKYGFRTT